MTARVILVILLGGIGALVGHQEGRSLPGAFLGLLLGCGAVVIENGLRRLSLGQIAGAIVGLFLGVLFANLLLFPLYPLLPESIPGYAAFALSVLLGYGGLLTGLRKGKDLSIASLMKLVREDRRQERHLKLLDTSVIVDGRIADVIESGFLEGRFIVPGFILEELQHIADSPDPVRRVRGKRGLEILQKIRKMPAVEVVVSHEDPAGVRETDGKLLSLARTLSAKLVTNDSNLHRIAHLQGVAVCNINELANAMKPPVLPGEILRLFVSKEGKEHNQGVAYLDDGTMVVIENGRQFIGRAVEAEVTSMLQTTGGRMVFARAKDDAAGRPEQ